MNIAERGLNESHFNAVAGHLQATLEELKVPTDLVRQVMAIAAGTHDDVLGL
jgi:hemoglobin